MQVLKERTACNSKSSMIYLTKPFTCVIASGWCTQVGIQSISEDVKAWKIRSLLWKLFQIKDNSRQKICIVKTKIRMQYL